MGHQQEHASGSYSHIWLDSDVLTKALFIALRSKLKVAIEDPTSTRDKINLQFISGENHHLTNRFCEDELALNSLLNGWFFPSHELEEY